VTQTNDSVTWLTQEAYDRLTAELKHLSGPGRVEIAQKIEAAREEGDLKENGGYHAAKEEQGKIELRIRQLTQLLEGAEVGAEIETGVAVAGAVVTVAFDGDEDDTMTFLLGSREDAADGMDVYSPQSPLGTAIKGKRVGEQATYDLPNGAPMMVKLLDAKPYVR
jgi:transcription elongation factor GreA